MIRTRSGQVTDFIFTVLSGGSPVTGLVDGSFTKRLYLNGASDAQTVTITELASGDYRARFTPDAAGHWHLVVRYTAGSTEYEQDFQAGYDVQAFASVVSAAGSTSAYVMAHLLRDGVRVTDVSAATATIYDLDGVAIGTKALDLDGIGFATGVLTLSAAIVDNQPYLVQLSITDPGGTYVVNQGLLAVAGA